VKLPYWPAILMRRMIRPAAVRAAITKWIGWHTFRHSYATLLIANGENVKVVQELMRHGSARITVDIYSQARGPGKRAAQQRLVQMILPEERSEGVVPSLESGHFSTWILSRNFRLQSCKRCGVLWTKRSCLCDRLTYETLMVRE
jgi:hypothetical protein